MIQKFRKMPVVIEAAELTYDIQTRDEIAKWCGGITDEHHSGVSIPTLEGTMYGQVGDYIIKGVNGEFYPCKPDIFAKTYEPVTEPSATEKGAVEYELAKSKEREMTPEQRQRAISAAIQDRPHSPSTDRERVEKIIDLTVKKFIIHSVKEGGRPTWASKAWAEVKTELIASLTSPTQK